jgi:choline dehydrogenase-like flavoprotein
VADWPITYDDLEPWYAQVEEDVGVSGLPWDDLPPAIRDRRSTPDMPFLPTREHPLADRIDRTCAAMGLHPFPTPRAVLPEDRGGRRGCAYTGYCGSYGCRTGAKGSALEVWLSRALATGRCEIRPRSMVTRLISDARGRVVAAETRDGRGTSRRVEADVFVVACQAVETARLLLASPGPRHPRGLANGSGHVGRHLISSTFAAGWGDFPYGAQEDDAWLRSKETFVNRSLQDWYFIDDTRTGGLGRRKGGTLDFLLHHPNPIGAAVRLATEDGTGREDNTGRGDGSGRFAWGRALRDRIRGWFRESRHLKFEVFGEWLPDRRCGVALDPTTKDRWGLPVARVNVTSHPRNRETAAFLAERGIEVLAALGARDPRTVRSYGGPSTNLLGGTCRFGEDPARSVLDPDCRAHDAENLFVTDGSFMPSGGGVPFTFTIYANALRVAERIVEQLGGPRR